MFGLWSDWDDLRSAEDPQRRGSQFEALIGGVFEAAHFDVHLSPGAALPRQTDLWASDGRDQYLVEVKWQTKPAGLRVVEGVRMQLERVSGRPTGVIVSMSGFTRDAVADVEQKRQVPILLFDEVDLDRVLRRGRGLRSMLEEKEQALATHGRALVGALPSPTAEARRSSGRARLADVGPSLVDLDGHEIPWVTAGGGYEPFCFVGDLPDVDWTGAGGFGVALEVEISRRDEAELVDLIDQMAGDRWISNEGWWTVRQQDANWHGIGGRSLSRAIAGRQRRYEGLDTVHHTEEVTYVGPCPGGVLRLHADVSAYGDRKVSAASVALQLNGIPVNPHPIEALCRLLDTDRPQYFRPLAEQAVNFSWPTRRDTSIRLEPIAYVVDPPDSEGVRWVSGLVSPKPPDLVGAAPTKPDDEWWPTGLARADLLVCDLRSHHPLGHPPSGYELWRTESTWLSGTFAARVVADWVRN